MKVFVQWVCVCLLILCFQGTVFAAAPFDDFSDSYLDNDLWYATGDRGLTKVREISGGKLISKLRGDVNRTDVSSSNSLNNRFGFANANSINSITASINLIEAALQGDMHVVEAEITGHFYDEAGGDVFVFHGIGYNGTDYYVAYEVYSDTNGSQAGDPFIIPITPGTEYIFKVEYDGNNTFTFLVNGESHQITGPARTGPSSVEWKSLSTGVWGGSDSGNGYVYATFDNVEVNGAPYDDFSSPSTGDKWTSGERARTIRDGKLQLNVQNPGNSKNTTDIWLNPTHSTDYFQAYVTIESDSVLTGDNTWAQTRVYGALYNDTYDGTGYNGSEGEVWGMTRIIYTSDGLLTPNAAIFRCDDDSCNSSTAIFNQDFPTTASCNIQLDTPATLSVKVLDDSIQFGCNDERLDHVVTGPRYDSRNDLRKLRSRVHSTFGESGYLKVTFDNVYLEENFPWNCFLPAILQGANK